MRFERAAVLASAAVSPVLGVQVLGLGDVAVERLELVASAAAIAAALGAPAAPPREPWLARDRRPGRHPRAL